MLSAMVKETVDIELSSLIMRLLEVQIVALSDMLKNGKMVFLMIIYLKFKGKVLRKPYSICMRNIWC